MNRDIFIQKLVNDAGPVRPLARFSIRLTAVSLVAFFSFVIALVVLGIRADFVQQAHRPQFWWESAALLIFSGWAAIDSLRLGVPGSQPRVRYAWLPLIAVGAWFGSLGLRAI